MTLPPTTPPNQPTKVKKPKKTFERIVYIQKVLN